MEVVICACGKSWKMLETGSHLSVDTINSLSPRDLVCSLTEGVPLQ